MDAQLLGLVREVILTGLTLALPIVLKTFSSWLSTRAKDERWRGANDRLERLVSDAVDEVEQTFVRPLKAAVEKRDPEDTRPRKCWCEQCMPEARKLAEEIVSRHLGAHGAAEIAARLELQPEILEGRIRTLIESAIIRRKR